LVRVATLNVKFTVRGARPGFLRGFARMNADQDRNIGKSHVIADSARHRTESEERDHRGVKSDCGGVNPILSQMARKDGDWTPVIEP
jgi:hypothetical protein